MIELLFKGAAELPLRAYRDPNAMDPHAAWMVKGFQDRAPGVTWMYLTKLRDVRAYRYVTEL